MQRAAALLALAAGAHAATCPFNRTKEVCPTEGQPCTNKVLCKSGYYCKIEQMGQDGSSYTGKCAVGPKLDEVYNRACVIGEDFKSCQFQDVLALNPYQPASYLQCAKNSYSESAVVGVCKLGPQKHGDGCNENSECASGHCLKEIRVCRGVDEGEGCSPGYPDPCMPDHYCAPDADSAKGGRCQKSVSTGKTCAYQAACARGSYCDGSLASGRRCVPMFSIASGANTTIGPYMCASGTAVQVAAPPSAVYTCVEANYTLAAVGTPCDPRSRAPMGFECKCAGDGTTRWRTLGGLGTGARTKAFKDLYQCLLTAQGPTGDDCQFDSADMERVRYGSCAFYACYPYYQALVNASGGRFYAPPLDQFEPTAKCESAALSDFYKAVQAAPCISISGMDNWKCASLAPPTSLSVAATQGVVSLIIISFFLGYWYHMHKFGGHGLPCGRFSKQAQAAKLGA